MSTIFPKWTNRIPTAVALSGGLLFVLVVAGAWYYVTPDFWRGGYMPRQPVNFSHQIHAGQLGMDCRYCHTHVEESYHANVPAAQTCMSCHTAVDSKSGYLKMAQSADGTSASAHWASADLAKVRMAYASSAPIEWRRVHKAPDYVQFPHMAHLKAGVSCFSCHSRIDTMPVVYQAEGMGMGFCLDCHRNPERHVVDTSQLRITDLRGVQEQLASAGQSGEGAALVSEKGLQPPQHCGACHY